MLLRMIGQINDRFNLDAFCRLSLRHEGVLGIGRLVVSLFRRCIPLFTGSASYTVDDIG